MLRLRIVGCLEAELDGAMVAMPLSERACALIGWLALHPGSHSRADVAARLWPDVPPERARANLRTALWAVHQSWGTAGRYVQATRVNVGLVGDDVWVDATSDDAADADVLLPGIVDDWADLARASHRLAVLDRLTERAAAAEQGGEYRESVRLSEEVCRLAPLDESAHRALLQRLLLTGDRASAIKASRDFARRLASELGIRPSTPTRSAHAQARAGRVRRSRPQLFGRSEEVAQLTGLWRLAAGGSGQIVVLRGGPGIGKTSLISDLVHRVESCGGVVATSTGMEVAGRAPFAAWLEMCDVLVGAVPPAPVNATWPRELNRLSGHLGEQLGELRAPIPVAAPELERLRVFEAVQRLVEWSCAHVPTLLVLDDADRADRASLRLTGHVGRRVGDLPVLMLLAHRAPTSRADLVTLIHELAGGGVPVVEMDVRPLPDVRNGDLLAQ